MRRTGCGSGLVLLLAIGVGTAPAHAQAARGTAAEARVEADVRRLSDEEVQAFLRRDPETMERLWSDDFVVTNPLNQFVTKRQVLDMVKSGVLIITSFDRQIDYVKVYGDIVVLAGRETVLWGGKMPNAGKTERLRITAVWANQQGRWQQVARHANVVPES